MYSTNFTKYILKKGYNVCTKQRINSQIPKGTNGVIDTISHLLSDYNDNNRSILNVMLKAY